MTTYPLWTKIWWRRLLWWSSMGLPVTDITRNLGFEAIWRIRGPERELCSAQMSSNAYIQLTMWRAP